MNKLMLTCAFAIMFHFSWCQKTTQTWYLKIVDSATTAAISGATISLNNGGFFFTNSSGVVELDKNIFNSNRAAKISCIGYKTLIFKLNGTYPDTLRLSAAIQTLNEVTVKGFHKTIVVGNIGEPGPGGLYTSPNHEVAEYIPNNNHITGVITTIQFELLDGNKAIKKPFKANLYAKKNGNVYPQNSLLEDSIIVYNTKGLKKVSVDVSKYNLSMPENGLFVSFRLLPRSWYDAGMVHIGELEGFPVPGIKGVFKNTDFKFSEEDEQQLPGVKYSLLRSSPDGEWKKFEYGTDFAMGVTVASQ